VSQLQQSKVLHVEELLQRLGDKRYHEFLRVPAMSAGIYVLQPGATDNQTPHKEAEIYYVVRGQAKMRLAREEREVREADVVFVEAGLHTASSTSRKNWCCWLSSRRLRVFNFAGRCGAGASPANAVFHRCSWVTSPAASRNTPLWRLRPSRAGSTIAYNLAGPPGPQHHCVGRPLAGAKYIPACTGCAHLL
jgi:uncharacterized cupin superfamily protein